VLEEVMIFERELPARRRMQGKRLVGGGSIVNSHLQSVASRLWVVAAILAVAFGSSQASQVRPLNIAEMTERADRVFAGRCVGLRVVPDPELGQLVTHVTFVVDRGAKGDPRSGNVTIRVLGSQAIDGLPQFLNGEEVVLFLYPDSRRGLTSPVGFGQGKFSVVRDKLGTRFAVNGFANENLLRNLSGDAQQRLGSATARWPARGPIGVDELLDAVESLTRRP
jgi:hypothetical protein